MTETDAGMRELFERMRRGIGEAPGPDVSAGPGVSVTAGLDVQIGRLCDLMDRQDRRRAAEAQAMAEAAAPIDIPPVDYLVTGGVPKFKAVRAAASDASPQEGFVWFVTRLSLAGLNAGDVVNIYRPAGVPIPANAVALHTFSAPAGVAAGLGIADWEAGVAGLVMRPDDVFTLQSAGTLAAAELILSGQALQIAAPYLARFIL